MLKSATAIALAAAATAAALSSALARQGGDRTPGTFDFSAALSADARVFVEDPQFPGQFDGAQLSVAIEPELVWESDSGAHQVVVTPFFRYDGRDDERTHGDLRTAFYRYAGGDWEVLLGVNKVFWGVAESRHLVDIINQDDAVEDIDGEDKLGQPMVKLSLLKDWGQLDMFVLPGFRERTFPGTRGRLRAPLAAIGDSVFEADAGEGHVDYAARYSHFFGGVDFGLSVFYGTSREPRFTITNDGQRLVPIYDIITQGGLDIQYTQGPMLLKFEGILREGQGDTFFATVAGFEYTLFGLFGQAWDLGLLSEYHYDGRDEFSFTDPALIGPGPLETPAPPTAFDNDVFVGTRLALNDIADTALLAGGVIDHEDGSTAMFVEASRRVGDNWLIELESRLFLNTDPANLNAVFSEDDFVNFRLTRHF